MGLRSIISEMPAKELRLHLKSLTDQQNGWLQDGSALLLFCSGQEHNANHIKTAWIVKLSQKTTVVNFLINFFKILYENF